MSDADFQSLGLTQGLIDHLQDDDQDHPMGYRCRQPYRWRSSPLAARRVIALWECGSVVSYFDPASRRFEQCSLENVSDVYCSYGSLQGLLAELFIDAYEDELELPELQQYAVLFGFSQIDRLLAEVEHLTGPDYDAWRQYFPHTV